MKNNQKVTVTIKRFYIDDFGDFGGYGEVKPFRNRTIFCYYSNQLKRLVDKFNQSIDYIKHHQKWLDIINQDMLRATYGDTDMWLDLSDEYNFELDCISREKDYIYNNLWASFMNIYKETYDMNYHGTAAIAYKMAKRCEQYM